MRRAIGLIATRVCRAHLCAQRWTMLAEVTPMNLVAPIAFCACPTASSRSCARLRCRCRHLHAVATSKPSRPSWRRPSASMMRPSKPWSRHGPAHDREMLADHQSRPALLESPTARSKSSPRSTASDHDGAVSSPKVILGKHRRDINFDCHVGPRQLADHQEC